MLGLRQDTSYFLSMQSITYKAPTRIDIAGGTVDIYPTSLILKDAVTVNMAIELFSEVKITPRTDQKIIIKSKDLNQLVKLDQFDQLDKINLKKFSKLELIIRTIQWIKPKIGLEIETYLDTPLGSGLGSSSSLLVCLLHALREVPNDKPDIRLDSDIFLINLAAEIEAQALQVMTGKQDYAAPTFGGVRAYHWQPSYLEAEKLVQSKDFPEIENRLILSYAGQSHFSGTTNLDMTVNFLYRKLSTVRAMNKINAIAQKSAQVLKSGQYNKLTNILSQEWKFRKSLAKGVTTSKVEKIIKSTIKAGAKANKLTGAGGGGCLVTYSEPKDRQRVIEALKLAGAQIMSFKISKEGVRKVL